MGLNYAVLLDSMPNPLLVINDADRIIYANASSEDFLQTSASGLARLNLSDVIPFASPLHALIQQVREQGSTVNEYAITIGTPRTGGERTVDVQLAAVHDGSSQVILTLMQRSMAQKIDRQLTHRGGARSVIGMASMLAHEIKNPLSGIRGAAQLLEPSLNGEDRALTQLICGETERIRNLVDQMEVFSDDRPIERTPTNIHAVLEHVKAIAIPGFARNIPIREEYDPSLPSVLGNRDQLVQVLLNLVKNAAEAIEQADGQGEITLATAFRPGIRLRVPGSGERVTLPLEVCVHDTGPGISEDIRPHLFDPFITTKANGKGLGLALVAKIVRDHGGVVECETLGRRTTFRILLPMETRHSEAHEPS